MVSFASVRVLALAGLMVALSGCGLSEGDGRRFETLALRVAEVSIPLTSEQGRVAAPPTAAQAGLRPAHAAPLRVEVMDPHDLWDAREDSVRRAVTQAVIPVAAEAVRAASDDAGLRPALTKPLRLRDGGRPVTTIQLGAFASEAAARAAWTQARQGPAATALSGLSPVFETVRVNGRDFTRLKVGPIPTEAAARLCRAAQVADPWCGRAG